MTVTTSTSTHVNLKWIFLWRQRSTAPEYAYIIEICNSVYEVGIDCIINAILIEEYV